MRIWLEKPQKAFFLALCMLLVQATCALAETATVSFEISSVVANVEEDRASYSLVGATTPVYTVTERFAPYRVVLDIAGGSFAEEVTEASRQLPQNPFTSLVIEDLADKEPAIKRFIFTVADSHGHSVEELPDGLVINFLPIERDKAVTMAKMDTGLILKEFLVESTPNTTTVTIVSNTAIENYTVDTIGSGANRPPRMYIDIAGVSSSELVQELELGTAAVSGVRVAVAKDGDGVRIVFDAAQNELFSYSVAPGPNGLSVVIDESAMAALPAQPKNQGGNGDDATLDELISSSEKLLEGDPDAKIMSAEEKKAALQDDFSFSGYNNQRISFDFYKIDVHNVFRLFRELSGQNIIIDEKVAGSVTLALDDVPWDFALDIILNLMNLKKEERFNTIVIYPASKEFIWPSRTEDKLDFEADIEILEQESIIIEKATVQNPDVVKAKQLIILGQQMEKKNRFEDAVVYYEKATELWPDNKKLLNKLATINLVNLGINPKAVHFARQSLELDPSDTRAALYAAIASANMQRVEEASEFFAQSISGTPPMKEALLSYASFSENFGQNEAALTILDTYQDYYGESAQIMIARARILDKIGKVEDADEQYKALLASGYQIGPDLKKYITRRLTEDQ